jgi:hypothetical protein
MTLIEEEINEFREKFKFKEIAIIEDSDRSDPISSRNSFSDSSDGSRVDSVDIDDNGDVLDVVDSS